MAIQQSVQVFLSVQGDGASTVFLFGFTQLFDLTLEGDSLLNPRTVPNAVVVLGQSGNLPSSIATIDGFGNLTLTFSSAPAADATGLGQVQLQLLFNSGVLSGTTATWTSATAVNTTWTLPLNGASALTVGFVVSGTITSGTILFEVSQDGAAWFPIQGAISNGYTVLTGWTQGVGSLPIQFDVAGYAYFRLRLNPVIAGTGTVTFILQGGHSTNEPVPVVGQANGAFLHTTLDDAAGGNAANTSVKGTQAARLLGVQQPKDSGRTLITLSAQATAGVIADAMLSFSLNKGGVVTAAQTSYTITNGKTFRIQSINYGVRAGAAAVPFSRLTLRSNTAGATVVGSAILLQCPEVTGPAATTGVGGVESITFPDGLEIAGNGTISVGMSHLDQATTNVLNVSISGYEY